MYFGSPLPWWLVLLAAAGIVSVSIWSYRRPVVPLSAARRRVLTCLRALSLGLIVLLLARPMVVMPPAAAGDVVVPILVDTSRSMRVADADGEPRIASARRLLQDTIVPALRGHARPAIFSIGEAVAPGTVESSAADGRRSDLASAVALVRERYRGSRVPAVVVLSDGAETGSSPLVFAAGAPVFAVGIGSPEGLPDREVVALTAGDPRLDQASVDLQVAVASRGFGRTPFEVRVLANGRLFDRGMATPSADGSPIDLIFPVSPDPAMATTYTIEVPPAGDEAVVENNTRSVLVSPSGRKRRVLVLTGAPGYEYSFLVRALSHDPSLEIDSVVRKGQNDTGVDTFLVKAGGGRAVDLSSGFPARREALFAYDALVMANFEGDYFTRAQLALAAEFVGERGGGLLVLGGRSFEGRGLTGTPIEAVLPVELNDRRAGRPSVAGSEEAPALQNRVAPTTEGLVHPIMRLGSRDETRARWAEMPALAAVAAVGAPRAGATVLAVSSSPAGTATPVVAVQRYGRGRSMVFAGEAAWRWRMLRPAADLSYEWFWRQALRWLSAEAPDPVTVAASGRAEPGEALALEIIARDRAFVPAPDATVKAVLTAPWTDPVPLTVRPGGDGRFSAAVVPRAAGAFRVRVEATRDSAALGAVDRWFLAGGIERELADPRLNEGFLRRLARATGGAYLPASDAARLAAALREATPPALEPVHRDLWHEPWAFLLVTALLAAEWILRRAWGLR